MTEEEKDQIRKLRTEGYSYQQIADVFGKSRSAISNYCHRHGIKAPDKEVQAILATGQYKLCMNCHGLFLLTSEHNRQFCSDKCRRQYWKTEQRTSEALEREAKRWMTLKKELDLSSEQSDELVSDKAVQLGRKKRREPQEV